MADYDAFDATFFGMSPREAELTDPQHRVFLETAWAAIEHAGYDPSSYDGRIGVFGGVASNSYFRHNLLAHPDLLARTGDYPLLLATEREYAITRTAYKLGLEGPAVSVNTACSTSAVAVHLAVASLLSGESDLAIAGGARVRVPATAGYVYHEDGILSADGHCRPFDAKARGTVAASGVALLTLKRWSDAIRDQDRVYALIRGSAINNDGAAKIGYTAPSVEGQAAVIEEALAVAEVDADSIGMVEAHGTGTSLGDPIEVTALSRVYRAHTQRRGYCAIGSLKSNIGHLDAGAGAAGIIKAALSLYCEQIPPSINFETPNPQIDLAASPFFVNTELRPWKRSDQPRRAAISAFGLGGTNAHVILEEAPGLETPPLRPAREVQVLTLSAKSAAALERSSQRLADHLASDPEADLVDTAWTLAVGRARMPFRRALATQDREGAVRALRGENASLLVDRETAESAMGVAFLFPGQGAQHPGMTTGLYRSEPVFKDALDTCADILEPILGLDLRRLIGAGGEASTLAEASVAQPVTFTIEYALTRLWMSWGIRPAAMIGHSLGEFAAACLGGVFTLPDALALVAARGRMMQDLGGGGMLAVMAEPERVMPLLDEFTALAAINAPDQVVASGPEGSIDALEERLAAEDIDAKRLPIGLAAHSSMMEPMVEPLQQLVEGVERGRLEIPMLSSATGGWLEAEQVADPGYWGRHARHCVRFSAALTHLLERHDLVLLEVGPGQTLSSLVRQHRDIRPAAVFASLPDPRAEVADELFTMRTLGGLWTAGVDPDWVAVHGGPQRRVPLPTYPFERERHWIDRPASGDEVTTGPPAGASPGEHVPAPSEHVGGSITSIANDRAPIDVAMLEPTSRKDRIAAQLASIIADLSGMEASALEPTASFADLGFDSLFLTQANSQFRKAFGVRITFRQLFEEAPSIDALAGFIDIKLPPDAFPAPHQASRTTSAEPGSPAMSTPQAEAGRIHVTGTAGHLEQLLGEQLRLVQQQLEIVRSERGMPGPATEGSPRTSALPSPLPAEVVAKGHYLGGPSRSTSQSRTLNAQQRTAIDELIRRTDARTPGSKHRAQQWRPSLADNRTIVGFDKDWKELVYQIVSQRSSGSRIWDVDGNEYIDTALGFGANLFGHSPPFVLDAVREQLERGFEVGVQNHLLGEVTELACRATGNERMAYTTSGGEAVETAIRVARTVTSRDKVAYFTDDIHGRSDIVLGRSVEIHGQPRSVPLVAGVPQNVIDDALVLAYGTDRALETIRAQASELALVLVEPVRTRNPDLQPIGFLRELRGMADEHGFLLVFDEIVTGFRAHIGGVQAMFGIRPDISTYGKVLGGGLPIGVVAGRSEYIDVIDGGRWSFGDDSFPESDITASGGTFIKHPLTLAAAKAVLTHLLECGPSLQTGLNERTSGAVAAINEAYTRENIPIHVEHFSSFFRPTFTDATRFAGLFQYYLREQGVHTNPPSSSFLSTTHDEADIEAVVAAYIEAGRAMGRDGLLETAGDVATGGYASAGAVTVPSVPVLPNVARFLVERETPDPGHWNLGVLLRPERPLDAELIRRTTESLVERHDALGLRFTPTDSGWTSTVAPTDQPVPVTTIDISGHLPSDKPIALERHAGAIQASLNLHLGPLFRIVLFDLGQGEQRLLVIIHHFAMDALSWRPFWEDFVAIYEALERGEPATLTPSSTTFVEWAHRLQRHADSDELRAEIPGVASAAVGPRPSHPLRQA